MKHLNSDAHNLIMNVEEYNLIIKFVKPPEGLTFSDELYLQSRVRCWQQQGNQYGKEPYISEDYKVTGMIEYGHMEDRNSC